MFRSRLMKYIAVALSAVLIANSALPAYAEEIGENIVMSYEDGEISDALSGQEQSGDSALEEQEISETDETVTDDETGDYPEVEDAGVDEGDEFSMDDAAQEYEGLPGDEFLTQDPVASVTEGGSTRGYTDFDEAVAAWRNAGAGAKLTLLEDAMISETIDVEDGTEENPMTLDLNDHGILYSGEEGNIVGVYEQGYLELTDSCSLPSEHYVAVEDGRGIGADIGAPSDGSEYFTVTGGFITGGNVSYSAGGVSVVLGTFVMNGGTILGNVCASDGAGIYNNGTFIMSGGEIRNNTAGRNGGGVYNTGKLILCGGEIRENTANDGNAICNRNSGTIDIYADIFCSTSIDGDGSAYLDNIYFVQRINTYGYIKALPLYSDHDVACVISRNGDTTLFDGFYDALGAWNAAGDGATLKLLDDVILTTTIDVNGGTEDHPMILDLNDHGVLYAKDGVRDAVVCVGERAFMELTDSSSTQTVRYITLRNGKGKEVSISAPEDGSEYVKVSGGYISGASLGISVGFEAKLTMSGGTVCGNYSEESSCGGVNNNGMFKMTGGKICRNASCYGCGGVYSDDMFIMDGGEVRDNTGFTGGGVLNYGNMKMTGGIICNNAAEEGGGVYSQGTILMNGGRICDNNAASGGGIYNQGTVIMNGGIIAGNIAVSGKALLNDNSIGGGSVTFDGIVHAGAETDGSDEENVSEATAEENVNSYGYIRVEKKTDTKSVAIIISRSGIATECSNFEEALLLWSAAGNGATLKLLDDVITTYGVGVDQGTEDYPMILDLNDHGIMYVGNRIGVKGGTTILVGYGKFFRLIDSASIKTEKYITLSEGRGTCVSASAPNDADYIKINGGYITGGIELSGIYNDGTFMMYGGTICGNTGGGVSNYGSFTMCGGTISDNISENDGGGVGDGSGLHYSGSFTMTGGSIKNNSAGRYGGGVYYAYGQFTLAGGVIENNTAGSFGGGVFNDHGGFSMSGGLIRGNNSGAVYNNAGNVEFDGLIYAGEADNGGNLREVAANVAIDNINGYGFIKVEPENSQYNIAAVISKDGSIAYFKNIKMAVGSWRVAGAGTVLKLLEDIRTTDTIVIDCGTRDHPMILDLNDHGILFTGETGTVISVTDTGSFELKDDAVSHTKRYINTSEGRGTSVTARTPAANTDYVKVAGGYITGGKSDGDEGAGVRNLGRFVMNGGTIAGNTAYSAGGVYNERYLLLKGGMITANNATYGGGVSNSGGNVVMTGGEIRSNNAENGGGVYGDSYFALNGGEISGNNAVYNGGGVYYTGEFTMTGGKIAGNLSDWNGGGVYNRYGTFTMRGGEISCNSADEKTGCCGGGIYNEYGTLTMSGGVIGDNKASDGKAVFNYADVEDVRFCGYIYARTDRTNKAHLVKADQAANNINTFDYIKVSSESSDADNLAIVSAKTGRTKEYKFFDEAVSAWKSAGNGATLKLLDDVETLNSIEIDSGTEDVPMILDLNDHGIVFAGDNGSVIDTGGYLIIKDCGSSHTRRYISLSDGRGLFVNTQVPENGTDYAEIRGGFITGGRSDGNGGGVLNTGTLEMIAGNICGNYAGNYGGGIFNTGSVIFSGGTVINNAAKDGGGVLNCGTFKMTLGEISGNTADNNGSGIKNIGGTVTFGSDVYAGQATDGKDAHLIDKETAAGEAESFGFIRLMDASGSLYLTHGIIAPQTYTGSAIMPEIIVHFGNHLLKEKQDYTISFSNNTNAGEASFTITGKGNFSGKTSDTFTILKKDITEAGVTVSEIPSSKCSSKEQKPVPTVAYGKKKLASGKDFAVTYYDDETCENDPVTPKDSGTYYVKVAGIGNFTGSVVLPFVIAADNEIPVSKLSVAKIADQQYTGGELEPDVTVKDGKNTLIRGKDYDVEYRDNTEIGTASAVITGIGGTYVGSRTVNFQITGTSLKKLTLEGFRSSFEYTDGNPKTQDIRLIHKMSGGNRILRMVQKDEYNQIVDPDERLNWDCTVEYADNVEIGTATMTLTGVNGYSDQIVKTYKITGTSISSAKIENFRDSFGYDGSAKTQDEMVLRYKNAALTKGTDYSVEYLDNTGIGKASMIIVGKGRFYGSVKKTFKITGGTSIGNALINDFISSYEYTGYEITQTGMTLSNGGTALTENDDYTVNYQKNTNAGTATMIITGKGWWYGTVQKTFKITPFDINRNNGGGMSISLESDKFYYSKSGVKPEPQVTFNGIPLTPGTDYTVSYSNVDAVRPADHDKAPSVKITGKGNFTNSTTLKFGIEKKNIADLVITADPVVYKNSKGNWKTKVTVAGPDGKKLSENKDYTIMYTSDEDGNSRIDKDKNYIAPEGSDIYVHIDAVDGSPYTGTLKGSYHIYKYDINKLSASLEPKMFTGSPVTLEEGDFVWKSGNNVAEDVTFIIDESTYKDNVNKGGASVVVYGTGECTGSKKITFTIGPRDVLWWWRNLFN